MKITTNHHARELHAIDEIPMRVVFDQFTYLLEDEADINTRKDDSRRFFRYRDYWYDAFEFTLIEQMNDNPSFTYKVDKDSPLLEWDGINVDSFFSGVLVKFAEDDDMVIVGTVIS